MRRDRQTCGRCGWFALKTPKKVVKVKSVYATTPYVASTVTRSPAPRNQGLLLLIPLEVPGPTSKSKRAAAHGAFRPVVDLLLAPSGRDLVKARCDFSNALSTEFRDISAIQVCCLIA